MRVFSLRSPLSIPTPTKAKPKKKFSLNLNVYRNTHYVVLNKVKIKYKELMREQIEELPRMERIHITYTIHPPTKRLFDISNVASVVDKFFCDALSELGRIPDDNYMFVPTVTYQIGTINRNDPHIDIRITSFNDDY